MNVIDAQLSVDNLTQRRRGRKEKVGWRVEEDWEWWEWWEVWGDWEEKDD